MAAMLLATNVLAQSAPTIPIAPIQSPAPASDMNQQLQGLMMKNPQAIGQAMVAGMMLGCIQKKVGKDATQAFYTEMQGVGKAVQADCKQGQVQEARTLITNTADAKRNDPVVQAALGCYDTQKSAIAGMGGPQIAGDMQHYADLIRDPERAKAELANTDICKNKTK